MKLFYLSALFLSLSIPAEQNNQHQHDDNEPHTAEQQSEGVSLTPAQMTLAEIQVAPLAKQFYHFEIYAPGEIKANGYTSYLLSPRVDSIVVKRHATLGQHIEKGAPLVTLFSADVATAQTNYRLAQAQWQRLKK